MCSGPEYPARTEEIRFQHDNALRFRLRRRCSLPQIGLGGARGSGIRRRFCHRDVCVLARHVAGGEDKFPDGMFREGAFFEQVVADALISRQQNPALRTYQGEPSLIRSSPRKVSEMALEADDKPSECLLDCAGIAEVFVEVQDKIVRRRRGVRVPNGWPLRFAAACSHIPRPMPSRTRVR